MKKIIIVLIGFYFIGCSSAQTTTVTAMREFHNSVGKEYKVYVEQDSKLNEWQKEMRKLNVRKFDKLITTLEEENKK